MRSIVLERSDRPLVSVLMVTYGGWDWARRALASVRDHTTVPYEVVVVDNASPDGTGTHLRTEVERATVLENERNMGFGPAMNQAAALARGGYLALLNSDALVRPGWVEPLIAALEGDPGVGAAVARLVNLDGTVQEAGSLLWSDGSTLALGDGAAVADPAYRFPRSTDFGSAACMVLRRSDFVSVGGFHPEFLPAYCEDVDLSLALGRRGLRTVYEPRAEAVHVRFASSDESRAARLIEANRKILRRRWADELRTRVPPVDEAHPHRLVAARDALALDRILVVGEAMPVTLLLQLAVRYPRGRITWLGLSGATVEPSMDEVLDAGVEVAGPPADLAAWFRRRLFQASAVVVLGARGLVAVRVHLQRTQPQALLIYDLGPVPSGVATNLRGAELEATRAARVVLCRTEGQARSVLEVAPEKRVRVVNEAGLPAAVVEELEAAGIVGDAVAEP